LGIINNAWKIGKSPDVWKYEEAVMLPKPGKDTLKIKNHRYITFSPVIGKVMERMIKKRLEVVMDQKKILTSNVAFVKTEVQRTVLHA
jgi:hypothetical protein